jgi:protein-L-isoaspartate(D-aspartate) O-methyltransferase
MNYISARKNMVDCQLATNGIHNEALLDLAQIIPREDFLPASLAPVAYIDEDVIVDGYLYLMEPAVTMQMIQALTPKLSDLCLVIGDYGGYVTAILSALTASVSYLDDDGQYYDAAVAVWNKMSFCNVHKVESDIFGSKKDANQYDVIFIQGSVRDVSKDVVDKLSPHGRIVCVVRQDTSAPGRIMIYSKSGEGRLSKSALQTANTPFHNLFEQDAAQEFNF